ncbi:MAG: hypothetical protein HGB12_14145 [Bacteroidetes bacterium]|nr:hypothetical protein [Bacteroidota bacterium]
MIKHTQNNKLMKLFSVFILLQVFSINYVNSQSFGYFSGGYNRAYTNLKNLNYVIDRYNETRTWLSSKMENITYLDGISFNSGGGGKKSFFDMSWSNRSVIKIAQGDNGSGMGERELKLRMNSFSFSEGFMIGGIDGFLPIYFGISMDLCQLKVFTRSASLGELKNEEYIVAYKKFLPATSFFLQHIITARAKKGGIGLLLKPYVQIPWYSVDFLNVNSTINPNTYLNDAPELKDWPINYGFVVNLAFWGR